MSCDATSVATVPPVRPDWDALPGVRSNRALAAHRYNAQRGIVPPLLQRLRVSVVAPDSTRHARGGGEIQQQKLVASLQALGVSARIGWSSTVALDKTDLLHLVGSSPEHEPLVGEAHRRGIPVVISPIAWFDWSSRYHASSTWSEALRGLAGLAARRLASSRAWREATDWRWRLYHSVDCLLPNSHAEARQLQQMFRVAPSKIRVVPNGADTRFASADATIFHQRYGMRGFVLFAGRIEPRKNQHRFLRALRNCGRKIVVLGDAAAGHERYAQQCRRIADTNTHFIGHVEHDDRLLASAYAACGCLALTSWFETPGLVALEAGMLGTPLVLTNRGATQEYFGHLARYASPNDEAAIRRQCLIAANAPRSRSLAQLVQHSYTWRRAAEETLLAYERVVRKHLAPSHEAAAARSTCHVG